MNAFQTTTVLFLSGSTMFVHWREWCVYSYLSIHLKCVLGLVISLFEAQEGHGIVLRDKDNPSVISCII